MTYVIGSACVDVMDKSCVLECPADCIYEGARSLYINADECVDCGACKSVCRMEAIEWETDLPDYDRPHLADNLSWHARGMAFTVYLTPDEGIYHGYGDKDRYELSAAGMTAALVGAINTVRVAITTAPPQV